MLVEATVCKASSKVEWSTGGREAARQSGDEAKRGQSLQVQRVGRGMQLIQADV